MNIELSKLRKGDWVQVRSAEEIAQTLDANGALDGLPFMPEMIAYCGKKIRFNRTVYKTCLEAEFGDFQIREMRDSDIALLEDLRCSGDAHDGCQRACTIFWKSAWLKPVGAQEQPEGDDSLLRAKLKVLTNPGRYFCQSTELHRLTLAEPMPRKRIFKRFAQDFRAGAVGVGAVPTLIIAPLFRKLSDKLFGRKRLKGSLTKTPVGTLKLQAGEKVEVKTLKEMQETLDTKGRNRGLTCDIELKKFCGKEFTVSHRLEKMISEPTGEMRKVEGTVVLTGVGCMCARAMGGCARADFMYWREIWLKRPGQAPHSNASAPTAT